MFVILGIIAVILKGLLLGGGNISPTFAAASNWVIILIFLVAVLILALGVLLALLQYRTSRIMFDEDSFHIVKGAVGKDEVDIPYRRIQSVEIKQPLIYRMVGVGHIDIATTTDLERPNQMQGEINEEVIPVIDYPLAEMVEKTLTDRAEVERFESVQKNQ